MGGLLKKLSIDTYMLLLIGTVLLATLLPVSGAAAKIVSQISYIAIALLFFLYGARLKTQAILAGLANWKFQLLVFATTFVFFPLVGWSLATLLSPWLTEELVIGFIFLSILPSTVQSSIALTGLARGNVPAAICSASLSNLLGVVLTPALAAVLLSTKGISLNTGSIVSICLQLLLPFAVGQLARPLIGGWLERHKMLTLVVDRGSILLIVYSAFSAGAVSGIWHRLDASVLSLLVGLALFQLLTALLVVNRVSRLCGLPREDEIAFLFCGSQKSLASGVPMANILFAGPAAGVIVLPLMIYHQFQLFLCTVIAQRYAARQEREARATAEAFAG